MIAHAGIGVAMGNAPDSVRQAANYIAPPIDREGVADAIERFVLGRMPFAETLTSPLPKEKGHPGGNGGGVSRNETITLHPHGQLHLRISHGMTASPHAVPPFPEERRREPLIDQTDYRVGQGYDIHRLIPNRPLLLGGVRIESPVGSDAHSEAMCCRMR